MKALRFFALTILVGTGCQDLPFFSTRSDSTPDGGGADAGEPPWASGGSGGSSAGVGAVDLFPGFGAADASTGVSNTAEGISVDTSDGGAFSIEPLWDADGGAGGDDLGFSFPDPSSLPAASATSQALALAGDARTMEVSDECGEPPTCYLRTIIATRHGHIYRARLSQHYSQDSCVTKVIDCERSVLVGDSNGRFGDAMCSGTTPQITFGFVVPETLFFGWQNGQVWKSTNGFKSEWTLSGAGNDDGSYEPIPGFTSKIWPLYARFFAGGEVYGEMLVPLRHTMTHELAIGFALFDIRVRQ